MKKFTVILNLIEKNNNYYNKRNTKHISTKKKCAKLILWNFKILKGKKLIIG
jgi:hypothetical protein